MELKTPYETLPKAGYFMVGNSNQFKKHINKLSDKPFMWFHCLIQPNGKYVQIHVDRARGQQSVELAYKNHKSEHRSRDIEKEIERIIFFEKNFLQKTIYRISLWITHT